MPKIPEILVGSQIESFFFGFFRQEYSGPSLEVVHFDHFIIGQMISGEVILSV